MKSLKIKVSEIRNKEVMKLLSFASSEIEKIYKEKDEIIINFNDSAHEEDIKRKVYKIIDNCNEANTVQDIEVFSRSIKKKYLSFEEIYNGDQIKYWGDGIISLNGIAHVLLDYFDDLFKEMAMSLGAMEKHYPVLLPVEVMDKTGYLRKTPQYPVFCCNIEEDIEILEQFKKSNMTNRVSEFVDAPRHVLSPAACFHLYVDYKNTEFEKNTLITLKQSVFRNEGRYNWHDFGRLKDYHVREIVFIGDEEYVEETRKKLLENTKKIMDEFNINCRICITFDPFVMPSMQKFKKVQLQEKSKYELQIQYGDDKYCAISSFNLHGTAFTNPFNIKVTGKEETVTGCVGFGLERLVLTFIAQYGFNIDNWPEKIRKTIKERL